MTCRLVFISTQFIQSPSYQTAANLCDAHEALEIMRDVED